LSRHGRVEYVDLPALVMLALRTWVIWLGNRKIASILLSLLCTHWVSIMAFTSWAIRAQSCELHAFKCIPMFHELINHPMAANDPTVYAEGCLYLRKKGNLQLFIVDVLIGTFEISS